MPDQQVSSDFRAIVQTLSDNAATRVTAVETQLDRHVVKDEGNHREILARIQAIELAMARAEGASLSRLLPWIALAVSAAGLAWNILGR